MGNFIRHRFEALALWEDRTFDSFFLGQKRFNCSPFRSGRRFNYSLSLGERVRVRADTSAKAHMSLAFTLGSITA